MPRLFVAIPLPSDVAERVALLVPGELPGLRPVDTALLHFTLAFIGALPEGRVGDATAAVRAVAPGTAPFEIRIDELGRFPLRGPARVVWAGSHGAGPEIARLGGRVREELAQRGIPVDPRELQPHVTLGRVRDGASGTDVRAIVAAVEAARVPGDLAFRADAAYVMESQISNKGPRYTPRATIPLGRA